MLVLGDVCIAVHAEHLWVRVDGEGVDGFQVALILQRDREGGAGVGKEACICAVGTTCMHYRV